MSKSISMRCPYCREPGRVRTSEEVTPLHRDVWFNCRNAKCGHTWKASLSFDHSISTPSSGVTITLPVTQARYRRRDRDGEPPPVAVPA